MSSSWCQPHQHHRLNQRLGDWPLGGPLDHKIGAGAAPDILAGHEHLDRAEQQKLQQAILQVGAVGCPVAKGSGITRS